LLMSSSPEAVGFAQVQASLAYFAEAMAGAVVPFEVTEEQGECWPQAASRPHDQVLRVPESLPSREDFRSVVLHHVQVEPSPTVAPQPIRLLFDELYPIVEDHRVLAATRRRFPGAADALDEMLSRVVPFEPGSSPPYQLRNYSLRSMTLEDNLAGIEPILDRVCAEQATAATSATVAEQLCLILEGLHTGQSMQELIGELVANDEEPSIPSDGPTSVSLDGGTPSEFIESDGIGGGHLLSETDESLPTMAAPSGADTEKRLGLDLPWSATRQVDPDLRTFVYDEWDYHVQRHRHAWCRVLEERLVGEDHGFIGDVRSRHHALRARVRRSLMKLRSEDLVRVYRSDDGEELDLDAAIECIADRRGGAPADERLHIRRDRAARDVATAFLVDLSASTSSPAVPPPREPIPETDPMDDPMSYGPIWETPDRAEPVRRVIDVAKDAVAIMGDAVHELGDRYAIYGFSGSGREAVEFKIGKDFKDRVSAASWASVAAMKPLRYTRMGPAVRHATAKLAAEPARTKLLIVVSDGYPQDTDYGRDRHDREYGIQDTARALADAALVGIETFCVTIDPAGHDYLRTMCPDDRYLVIEDVESLPEALANLYVGRFHTPRRVEVANPA